MALVTDSELSEQLFRARPSWNAEKDAACYTRWRTGEKFDGCKPNCGCPRAQHISQQTLDTYRVEQTKILEAKTIQALQARKSEEATWAIYELERISEQGRAFVQHLRATI